MYNKLKFLCIACEWRKLSRLSFYRHFRSAHSIAKARLCLASRHTAQTEAGIVSILIRPTSQAVVSNLYLPTSKYHSVDSTTTEPSSCESVTELFELIDTYSSKEIPTHKHLVQCCSSLYGLVYAKEFTDIPWMLSPDRHIVHKQILINEQVDKLLGPFINHSSFEKLLSLLDKHVNEMSSDHLCTVFSTLQMLGLPETHPLIYKIFIRLCDENLQLSLSNLALTTECLRNFTRRDVAMAIIVAPRIEDIFRNGNLCFIDKNTLNDLCKIFVRIKGIVSASMNMEAVNRVLKLASMKDSLQDPISIASCIRFVRSISAPYNIGTVSDGTISKLFDILEICVEKLQPHIPTFEPQHVAQLCINMRRMGIFNPDLADKIHNRCIELLSKPVTVAELSCIMHGVKKNMPLEVRRNIEDRIHRHLHNADIFILSELAITLKSINCTNNGLVSAYEQAVLANIDKLSQYISLLHRVLYFLMQNGTKSKSFQARFQIELLRLLNTQHGISVWCVSILSWYLLPSFELSVPQILMNRLTAIIPQCELRHITKILGGLNLMHRPLMHQIHSQLLDLHTVIYKNVGTKLQNIENIFLLCQMIDASHLKSHIREPAILNQLMNQLPMFTKNLTIGKFNRLLSLFRRICYYQPEVYDDMISFAINNNLHLDFFKFHYLLFSISRVGYHPKQMEEFASVCTDVLEKCFDDIDVLAQLNFIYNMCILQTFPDDWLKKIFTFEYLEEVDKFNADSPEARNTVELLMMRLNRCVVIDCPHLDVPWFHEDFCEDKFGGENTVPVKHANHKSMLEQVEMALTEILGGDAFFGQDVHSTYFYPLHFECLLNSKDKPVSYATGKIVWPEDMGYQRVAFLVQPESNFCVDSKHLRGYEMMKKRHLEIMGYKVVELPYFDWQLMALTDWTAKVDYLQKKIFS